MLHVQRRDDVAAGVTQLLDILPALFIYGAGRVGVGDLVDQGDFGPPLENRIEIHLLDHRSAIGAALARDQLEPAEKLLGAGTAIGLDVADSEVLAPRL